MSYTKIQVINKLNQLKPTYKPVATFDEDRCKIILDEDFKQMIKGFETEKHNN